MGEMGVYRAAAACPQWGVCALAFEFACTSSTRLTPTPLQTTITITSTSTATTTTSATSNTSTTSATTATTIDIVIIVVVIAVMIMITWFTTTAPVDTAATGDVVDVAPIWTSCMRLHCHTAVCVRDL